MLLPGLRATFLSAALFAACFPLQVLAGPQMGEQEKVAIAELIFANECAGKIACLTSWNKGEEFASLGIGHFIWYPAGTSEKEKRFSESFPALVHFMRQKGVGPPAWLQADAGCPWPDRLSFTQDQHGTKLKELRSWLEKTMPMQANFMASRLAEALPRILKLAAGDQREHIRQQFERVAASPMGIYALMDYVNFKGEGINPKERYNSQGWGLLQVLSLMRGEQPGVEAISGFADAADTLLTQRVAHAPDARQEERWLPGWRKRLQTYQRAAEEFIRAH